MLRRIPLRVSIAINYYEVFNRRLHIILLKFEQLTALRYKQKYSTRAFDKRLRQETSIGDFNTRLQEETSIGCNERLYFLWYASPLGTQSRKLAEAQRKRFQKSSKHFPHKRDALDDLLSQKRKEEQSYSSSTAATDDEPIVVRTKVTVKPLQYNSDSSSAEATYKGIKFQVDSPKSPKVPKSLHGLNVKRSANVPDAAEASTSTTHKVPEHVIPGEQNSDGKSAPNESHSAGEPGKSFPRPGENTSSQLSQSSELSASEDVLIPLSGFITKKSNHLCK